MSTPSRYAQNGARRRQIVARHRARVRAGEPCAICGRPIDLSIQYPQPWSFVVDEIVPVAHGGSPLLWSNTEPAHRWCNGIKSTRSLQWAREEVARQLAGVSRIPDEHRAKPSRAPFTRLDV